MINFRIIDGAGSSTDHRDGSEAVRKAIEVAEPVALETPEETVRRLAALPPLEYDSVRESEAQQLGVRAATLDAEVHKARRQKARGNDDVAAGGLALADPEPWPDPVDGNLILDELVSTVRRYLILPAGGAETIALWVLHAHLHDTASISPILAVTSPSPECGKTTLLDLLGALVPRPLPASNITAAALFRAVDKWHPTMLVDEADTFIRDSDELRGVLNSGHRRSSAYVIRTVGDDHEPRHFRTWAPKAIALIGKLPATLTSRSIEIELRRKTAAEHVDDLRGDRLGHLDPLRRQCARFQVDRTDVVRTADPGLPPSLRGRGADNWRHLIAIADAAGGDWPRLARQIAVASTIGRIDETSGIMLLEDIQALFAERAADLLSSAEIVQALGKMEDRPWAEWKAGNPITVRQLARLLEPFKVAPTKFRAQGYTPGTRGYEKATFTDTFARYLPDTRSPSATAPQANESAISNDRHPPQPLEPVADGIAPEAMVSAACGVVADENAEGWEGVV